jgi:hypothetical protein
LSGSALERRRSTYTQEVLMAAVAMPDVDRRKLERIRDRLTPLTAMDLSEIELPGLEQVGTQFEQFGKQLDEVGKHAARARDRLSGRSRRSIWPRLALGLGLLALVGLAVVVFGSSRRSPWSLAGDDLEEGPDRPIDTPPADLAATTLNAPSRLTETGPSEPDAGSMETPTVTGLTAAEASLMSTDPSDETLP